MKNVAIIILNWNGKKDTIECLESITKLRTKNFEPRTIVVDNGSTDGSVEEIQNSIRQTGGQNYKLKLKVIQNSKNLGYSGGNNVGIKFALEHGADYILILNNDTIVDKSLVVRMVEVAKNDEDIGIIAPKIYFAPGFEFHKNRYKKSERGKVIWYAGGVINWANVFGHHRGVDEVDEGQYDNKEETDYASGCAMLVKKEAFDAVGFLDEKYFLYYEDNDISQKVKRVGLKVVYTPDAYLWHKNAGSGGGAGSHLQDYYITRNRLLFGMRYAPVRSKLALVRESIVLLGSGRQWQRRGVIDFYAGRFGKGSFLI